MKYWLEKIRSCFNKFSLIKSFGWKALDSLFINISIYIYAQFSLIIFWNMISQWSFHACLSLTRKSLEGKQTQVGKFSNSENSVLCNVGIFRLFVASAFGGKKQRKIFVKGKSALLASEVSLMRVNVSRNVFSNVLLESILCNHNIIMFCHIRFYSSVLLRL